MVFILIRLLLFVILGLAAGIGLIVYGLSFYNDKKLEKQLKKSKERIEKLRKEHKIKMQLINQRNKDFTQIEKIKNEKIKEYDYEINKLEEFLKKNPIDCHLIENCQAYNNFLKDVISKLNKIITKLNIKNEQKEIKDEYETCCEEFKEIRKNRREINYLLNELFYGLQISQTPEKEYKLLDKIEKDYNEIKKYKLQINKPIEELKNRLKKEEENFDKNIEDRKKRLEKEYIEPLEDLKNKRDAYLKSFKERRNKIWRRDSEKENSGKEIGKKESIE